MPDYSEALCFGGGVQIWKRLRRHIAHLTALNTSHMVMLMHTAIVLSLPATGLQPVYQSCSAEDLKVPIHRPQTDPRHHPPHPFIYLVSRRMPPGPRTPDFGLRTSHPRPLGSTELIQYQSPLSGHPHRGRRAIYALLIHNNNCYYSMGESKSVNRGMAAGGPGDKNRRLSLNYFHSRAF